jgi:hypothetical protein
MKGKTPEKILLLVAGALFVLSSCNLYTYGKLGGADQEDELTPGSPELEQILLFMSGVWYSHYAGVGRLDGYRIGRWQDFDALVRGNGKAALFPALEEKTYTAQSGSDIPKDSDYFIFYDDTVYGQKDDDSGGRGGWEKFSTRYIGIVRGANIFYGNKDRGAIIIEYLKGCAPQWDDDIKDGQRPFFGIYYRVLDNNIVQIANAVNLAALYEGKKYYIETKTLEEAIAFNTVENAAEFISWGVVIPQDRDAR